MAGVTEFNDSKESLISKIRNATAVLLISNNPRFQMQYTKRSLQQASQITRLLKDLHQE
jgi:hypothetical protein